MDKRKRKILIISITAVLVTGGFVYYYLYGGGNKTINNLFGNLPIPEVRRVTTTTPLTKPKSPQKTKEELEKEARLIQVVSKPIVSPTLSKDGVKILFYAKAGGNLEAVSLDGKNEEKLSSITLIGLLEALWQNPDKEATIVTYIESNQAKKFISSIATSGVIFLPQNITSVNWSPDGKQIAYFIKQKDSYNLTIADSRAQKPVAVFSTPIPDFNIFWASKDKIFLVSRPSGLAPGILFYFDTIKKTLNKILTEVYGLTVTPSSNGNNFIYSKTDSFGRYVNLYYYDFDNKKSIELNVATLPEKCVFKSDNQSLICAVPKNLSMFKILPDDWYMGSAFFQDRFIQIDITDNQSTSLTAKEIFNERNFDAFNLFLSQDSQFLFFQDKNDLTLWRLKL